MCPECVITSKNAGISLHIILVDVTSININNIKVSKAILRCQQQLSKYTNLKKKTDLVKCLCSESFLAEEEDISDGEVTDLLADMDQSPSTSSRLRASTVNRPSNVTERRWSVRLQSRGESTSLYRRPETSWVSLTLKCRVSDSFFKKESCVASFYIIGNYCTPLNQGRCGHMGLRV